MKPANDTVPKTASDLLSQHYSTPSESERSFLYELAILSIFSPGSGACLTSENHDER